MQQQEVFGFIRPGNDVHSLGISSVGRLLEKCGYKVLYGDKQIAAATETISNPDSISLLTKWIFTYNISRLGFSYRLDPNDARTNFGKVFSMLQSSRMFSDQGGILRQIYFAGLPEACAMITSEYQNRVPVFAGDETSLESLEKLGIPRERIPGSVSQGSKYDDERNRFATSLILQGEYTQMAPPKKPRYAEYGSFDDTIAERIRQNQYPGSLPLTRVHVGPYNPDYREAKKEFLSWLKTLSETGYLDIVSVGSSQLSQSNFGENWGDKPNGGGVPINSEQDLSDIWNASRPMLVRTYAGTKNIPTLASIYEKTINIAWHALSFWWFNQIDGRGPYGVLQNLEQHFETMRYIASTNKPLEPNVPHHFAFRGGDDFSYVLSGYLAARAARRAGIKHLIVQTMLNTPRYSLGIQDLAKTRALIRLARTLENTNFTVYLQPRAGLDYFSPDLNKARIQLASVSAMMDDIEPARKNSPDIIHVVSYCEAVKLATPEYINESIQISLTSIEEYRKLKLRGHIDNMLHNEDVENRTQTLIEQVVASVAFLESRIPDLYTPAGFYKIFQKGVFATPYLWEGRDEFAQAANCKTDFIDGGVCMVDDRGKPINPFHRLQTLFN